MVVTITVRFPATKQPAIQGLGQLLGSRKDFWKEKGLVPASAKDDSVSMSNSETPEDATSPDAGNSQDAASPMSIAVPDRNHELFSPPAGGKCRLLSRLEHNLCMMSLQFITRVTFLFFSFGHLMINTTSMRCPCSTFVM